MTRRKNIIIISLILFCGLGAGLGLLWATQNRGGMNLVANAEATLPEFAYPDLAGVDRASGEWNGQVMLVNYWATWCPPCRQEMPHFVDAQREFGDQGLRIIGIAIDDPELVRDFVDLYNINFPILIGGLNAMEVSKRMGNQFETLPYSAIYDRDGKLVLAHAGMFTAEQLHEVLSPLL